jgi:hypothetical protein
LGEKYQQGLREKYLLPLQVMVGSATALCKGMEAHPLKLLLGVKLVQQQQQQQMMMMIQSKSLADLQTIMQ